jgi:integrase
MVRTAVRSGHGVGKTLTAAVIALWFLDTHPRGRCILTATSWIQVERMLMGELRRLHSSARSRPEAQGRPILSGEPSKVIQKVMGHARIQMTFDRYGHLMPGGLEEAAAAADAYLERAAAS